MAGYILKIVIEDTHPPVWRRIVIPERTTFAELHEMIQIIFGWTDSHLHEFSIPSERIRIGCDTEEEDLCLWGYYQESETLVENFFPAQKWIRYIYDFGDEWRHKIICEKTDDTYKERCASLLKVKGDNFEEDTGGVWAEDEDGEDAGWNRSAFDRERTEDRLRKLTCPLHEELSENMCAEAGPSLEKMLDQIIERLGRSVNKKPFRTDSETPSPMARKVNAWRDFLEQRKQEPEEAESDFTQLSLPFVSEEDLKTEEYTVRVVPGEKTQEELLRDLGWKEAWDYCKYLQIPEEDSATGKKLARDAARMLKEHPEYILYVFGEKQYREFVRMSKLPCGIVRALPKDEDVLIMALRIGLADVTVQKSKKGVCAELSFARDLSDFVDALHADLQKKTFRKIDKFSKKLEHLVLVYGLIDLDSLYRMFQEIYRETSSREDIFRCVYWHARMKNKVVTASDQKGKHYVCAPDLDAEVVLKNQIKYAADLDFVIYPAAELKRMGEDINERSDWLDILYTTLHYRLDFPADVSTDLLVEIFITVMEGYPITEVLDVVYPLMPEDAGLAAICELWQCAAGLMTELDLPMLKGRSRNQYEEETGVPAWRTGMIEESVYSWTAPETKEPAKLRKAGEAEADGHSREKHIWEFPGEIQEAMYRASEFASQEHSERLWEYQEKEQISSEEFLYLLAQSYVINCDAERAEPLIRKLENSSARGKKAAEELRANLKEGYDVMDGDWDYPGDPDDGEFYPEYMDDDFCSWYQYKEEMESARQPYVRETPKIGRNDPCPCGSGKKYKKCCGRNR